MVCSLPARLFDIPEVTSTEEHGIAQQAHFQTSPTQFQSPHGGGFSASPLALARRALETARQRAGSPTAERDEQRRLT